jgi:hypothetical protein
VECSYLFLRYGLEVMRRCAEVMAAGEFLTTREIAERLRPLAAFWLTDTSVYMFCHQHPELFEKRKDGNGQTSRVCFALRS